MRWTRFRKLYQFVCKFFEDQEWTFLYNKSIESFLQCDLNLNFWYADMKQYKILDTDNFDIRIVYSRHLNNYTG